MAATFNPRFTDQETTAPDQGGSVKPWRAPAICGVTLFTITAIVGVALYVLAILGLFGPIGSTGFYLAMIGGVLLFGLGVLAVIAIVEDQIPPKKAQSTLSHVVTPNRDAKNEQGSTSYEKRAFEMLQERLEKEPDFVEYTFEHEGEDVSQPKDERIRQLALLVTEANSTLKNST